MATNLNLGKFTRISFVNEDRTLTREAAAELEIVKRVTEASGAPAAVDVAFTPAGGIAAVNVQAAIEELEGEKADAAATTAALAGKQPVDSTLTALAGVTTTADQVIYATGVDAFATAPLTAFARTMLDDVDAAAVRATIGAGTGGGDVTGGGTASGTNTGDQFTSETASTLIGRGAGAGAGPAQEITVGSGLTMTGTTLSAAAGSGDVVGPASAVANNVVTFNGTTGKIIKDSGLALAGTNTGDETTTTAGALINAATSKATPVDADYVGLMDSAASNILKKLSWANIKATLKTYLDTLYAPITAPAMVSAFLTGTQANSTLTPAVITGHTFTLTPGQVLSLTGQVVFTAAATTTGLALGVRVAQAGGADAHAIGSTQLFVGISAAAHQTGLSDGDAFDVAAGANALVELVGTATSVNPNGSGYQLSVKNLATNANTTVTIEFRTEVDTSAVTLQIGTGCAGVKA